MDLNRLPEENFIDFTYRLLQAKEDGLIDVDKSELYNIILNETASSDHSRKVLGGIRKFIDRLKTEGYENITEDSVLKELQVQQREIYKERQKFRDEKNEYSAWLREQSRMELFFERIDEAVDRILEKRPREIPSPIPHLKYDCEMFVALADPHYGVEFEIQGFNETVLNKYNPEIYKARMWKLRDEIVDFCNLHNTKKINMVDLGDSIEGILHLSQLKSLRGNIVDDILDYSEFMADWIEDLSKIYIVDFYTSEGNHSDLRLLTGKKGDFPNENLEKIYSRTLQRIFKNNPNVTIHKSLDGLNYFEVLGYKFLTAHGNYESNIKNSIKDYEDTYKIEVNYFIVGHLHCKNEIETAKGKEAIQVRSIMGINSYSTTIKKTSDAGALMFTVHDGYGKKYVNEVKFKD